MRKARAALLAACGTTRKHVSVGLDGEATITGVARARRAAKGKSVRLSPVLDFRAIRCAQISAAAFPSVPVAAGSVPALLEQLPESQPEPGAGPARGINVTAFHTSDHFMSDAALQGIIANYGIPYLRVPISDFFNQTDNLKLLNAIKNAGARPEVIVHGNCPVGTGDTTRSNNLLNLVDQVFPTGNYYVEYGNEEDLINCSPPGTHTYDHGQDASTYAGGWNRDVPMLKANHPRALFMGPVNFQYNGRYVETFLRNAVPRPDGVSWHEYECAPTNSDQTCLNHIARLSIRLDDYGTRAAAVGYKPPVWITEWNLDSGADSRYSTSFIQTWTQQMLAKLESEITAGRIAVAEQYAMAESHPLFNSDNSLTLQGQAFFGE
jgi:hypothetical protein